MRAANDPVAKIAAPTAGQTLGHAVVTTAEGLEALESAWRGLFEATPFVSGSQSFDYAIGAWRCAHADRDGLHVVIVREGPRLVAVWPLGIRRAGGLRTASHLGRGSDEEYAGPVIAPGPRAGEIARHAMAGVRGAADVLTVFNVHPASPIRPCLESRVAGYRAPSPVRLAGTSAFPDLPAWLSGRSRNLRSNVARSRQRLERLGPVRIQPVSDAAAVSEFVDWLFTHKLAQLDSRGVKTSWLRSAGGRRLVERILGGSGARPCAEAFELTVAGRRAAGVVTLTGARLELAVTTYDPAFAEASPGAALLAFVAQTAIARGLDLDFRFGQEAYKAWWTDAGEVRWNYVLALSPLGCAGVAGAWGRWAARRLRRRLGPPVRRLLAR